MESNARAIFPLGKIGFSFAGRLDPLAVKKSPQYVCHSDSGQRLVFYGRKRSMVSQRVDADVACASLTPFFSFPFYISLSRVCGVSGGGGGEQVRREGALRGAGERGTGPAVADHRGDRRHDDPTVVRCFPIWAEQRLQLRVACLSRHRGRGLGFLSLPAWGFRPGLAT